MPQRKEIKTNQILAAAMKVFAEKGYHYATVEDIAREAGVAKGSIHAYFENKLDVLLSIVLQFWQTVNQHTQQKLLLSSDSAETLKMIFDTFQELLLRDEQSLYWGKILREGLPKVHMIKSQKLKDKQNKIDNERKALMKTIDSVIDKAQAEGALKSTIKPQVLRQILGGASQLLVYGLFIHFSQGQGIGYDKDDVRDAMRMLIDLFSG